VVGVRHVLLREIANDRKVEEVRRLVIGVQRDPVAERPPSSMYTGSPRIFPAKSQSAMSTPLTVGMCTIYVWVIVLMLWK
jgi:hypothetical protein